MTFNSLGTRCAGDLYLPRRKTQSRLDEAMALAVGWFDHHLRKTALPSITPAVTEDDAREMLQT